MTRSGSSNTGEANGGADPIGYVVGIDLGTTHTVVAFTDRDGRAPPRIFEIPQLVPGGAVEARPLLPSFLYAPLPGEHFTDPWNESPWILGEAARQRGQEVPSRLVSSAKSWLCHGQVDRTAAILPWGHQHEDAKTAEPRPHVSPVEASARILQHVRGSWDAAFPEHPLSQQQVVLTVPASFDQSARQLTLVAAQRAGLTVRLLEEPQAAFYDFMASDGIAALHELADHKEERRLGRAELATERELSPDTSVVLVCDVGGGTTDLTLISVARAKDGELELSRRAVGRHLLLGGDNIDLALAQICEPRLVEPPDKLDPQRYGQLVMACRGAKERLLGPGAPERLSIGVLGRSAALVGNTLQTELTREEVERVVLDGFFPAVPVDAQPTRSRAGLVAFGLPYESDATITRHIAQFLTRHEVGSSGVDAVLLNGGLFQSERVTERLLHVLGGWAPEPPCVLPHSAPDLAVARGAVRYGLALEGHGVRIGGGSAHGYYVAVAAGEDGVRKAVCVVPRGAKEGEPHLATPRGLALQLGRPARFELYASDATGGHAPGQVVRIDDEQFELLPPIATAFDAANAAADAVADASSEQVRVGLRGELTAIGTVDLACVELAPSAGAAREFSLAFDLRGHEPETRRGGSPTPRAQRPSRPGGQAFAEACEAIQRVFGKGRKDVKTREAKDLVRELERLLGERQKWSGDLTRALFDVVGPKHKARRRSADHERVYWMLCGYCLRPGFGHPLDPQRVRLLEPLFAEGVTFAGETRSWQQFFIAWRRIAGGLPETAQVGMRDLLDPYLAPSELKLKKPKGFKPPQLDEILELGSWLERVPARRREELGRWVLERTWTDRNPRLWEAIGRIGARVPTYASAHHVVAPRAAERWLDHLLREKWEETPSAPRAATHLARVTHDRARDISEPLRHEVVRQLERGEARADWIETVRHFVSVGESERAEFFGEELPVGLQLVEDSD